MTTGVLVCSSIYFLLLKECVDVDSLNSEICVCASWSCPIHTSLVGLCVNSTNTLRFFWSASIFKWWCTWMKVMKACIIIILAEGYIDDNYDAGDTMTWDLWNVSWSSSPFSGSAYVLFSILPVWWKESNVIHIIARGFTLKTGKRQMQRVYYAAFLKISYFMVYHIRNFEKSAS